jgi:hypothetical protein
MNARAFFEIVGNEWFPLTFKVVALLSGFSNEKVFDGRLQLVVRLVRGGLFRPQG